MFKAVDIPYFVENNELELKLSKINSVLSCSNYKEIIEDYFKEYKGAREIDLTDIINLNAEKLRIVLNSVKHIKCFDIYLNYNYETQFKDSDDEVIDIIGEYLKDTVANNATINLPREFGENAAKKLFPYFKESKIEGIKFSESIELSDETIEKYNSIATRIYAYNDYFNCWEKNKIIQ